MGGVATFWNVFATKCHIGGLVCFITHILFNEAPTTILIDLDCFEFVLHKAGRPKYEKEWDFIVYMQYSVRGISDVLMGFFSRDKTQCERCF